MSIDVELDKLSNKNMDKLLKQDLFKLCEQNGIIKYKSKNTYTQTYVKLEVEYETNIQKIKKCMIYVQKILCTKSVLN